MEGQPQNQHTHWVTLRPPTLPLSLSEPGLGEEWVALPSLDCPAPVSPGHSVGKQFSAQGGESNCLGTYRQTGGLHGDRAPGPCSTALCPYALVPLLPGLSNRVFSLGAWGEMQL